MFVAYFDIKSSFIFQSLYCVMYNFSVSLLNLRANYIVIEIPKKKSSIIQFIFLSRSEMLHINLINMVLINIEIDINITTLDYADLQLVKKN